jgi:hypothetical protein
MDVSPLGEGASPGASIAPVLAASVAFLLHALLPREETAEIALLNLQPDGTRLCVYQLTVSCPGVVARRDKSRRVLDELKDGHVSGDVKDTVRRLDRRALGRHEEAGLDEFVPGSCDAAHGEARELAEGLAPSAASCIGRRSPRQNRACPTLRGNGRRRLSRRAGVRRRATSYDGDASGPGFSAM